MKKSLLAILLIISIIFLQPTFIKADNITKIMKASLNDQLSFKLDGKLVTPVGDDGTPVLPISYNGTTYLPVRAVGYLLGLGIDYENSTKTVLITKNSDKASPSPVATTKTGTLIPITGASLNGQLKFKLDGKAVIPVGDDGTPVLPISYNGTTYLPIRAIGYLLGLGIDYENSTKTVLITKGDITNPGGNNQNNTGPGWYFTHYTSKDNDHVGENQALMGTTSYMYDVWKSSGQKGSLEMSHKRYDHKTGILLAGVEYKVIWSDPQEYLAVGDKPSINFERITISSQSWKPNQNSANFNQGMGVNFATPDGIKYINQDINTTLTMEKEVAKGIKGQIKRIQLVLGDGWVYEYHYEWRD